MGMQVLSISVSRNHKWMVCGTRKGASVWDGEICKKVVDVEHTNFGVWAVDISPDSTRFATGTVSKASIWSITRGERLVGPLRHNAEVTGIRFSPTGEHFATACLAHSIRVFHGHTGDELVTIKIDMRTWHAVNPLAWSSDAQQIFAASRDNKIRSFNVSTGSLIADSQQVLDDNVHSIALAANDKFIATSAEHSISFLDASTLSRIGPVVEDGKQLESITISADSRYLATGRADGKIVIRDLSKILPDSCGPFHVSICAFIVSACQIIPILSPMMMIT